MDEPEIPPAVCIVGRKDSGKTTLTVALAAELKSRGRRVATIKHGHHAFETDEPGRDSWRHFNEGGAEATLMCGTGKVALTMRIEGEPDPAQLIREFYAGRGYDVVLVEGFKHGDLPKIEVFRRARHDRAIYDPDDHEAARHFIGIVTDDGGFDASIPVIVFDADDPLAGGHVEAVANLVEHRIIGIAGGGDEG
jgi:molybdopterin-guanine dinucleotide biosynthesis protein MobB